MQTNPSVSFGDLLKRFRLAAGLSQEELAERSRLSPRGVSDLERGARTNPRPGTVRLLADALTLSDIDHAAFLAAAHGARGYASRIPGADPQPTPMHEIAPDRSASPLLASASSTPSMPPTGTVTFLFTDIEGSTQLLQQIGARYADALSDHQRILRAAFAAHSGYEVDTQGDSFFVAFPTAPDALAAAAEAIRALTDHPWPEGVTLRVRMGLHTGAPQLVGAHYVGLDVHRAARIAAAGHGGQILLSASTRALVEHNLPEGATLRELGAHRLKDLQRPEPISQLVRAGLPADFPPLKTLNRQEHNLPIQPTLLLGRDEQLAAVAALLHRADVRLVTVTGPGGIGKTRLALQAAAEALEDFPDGVYFVRLSRLVDSDLALPTILQTLGLKEMAGQSIADTLHEYLREKQVLLVLDNFEQVVAAALDVGELVAQCAGLKVIVTSRVPLRLRAEHEFPLGPLSLPDLTHLPPPERLTQYVAVALFMERAEAARPDFAVTAANAPTIAEICARLDGLPLAIELAAAWVKLLTPEALLARLSHQLQALTGGARDLEARQQTMRNTLAWSYGLLAPEAQRLFRRLAVFVGGCTLEAAEAVCVAPEGAEPLRIDLLEGLSQLADHSLVQQREETGEPRFTMLHVIREYAMEWLGERGEPDERPDAEALQRAHAAYYLALADEARSEMRGPRHPAFVERLKRDYDNMREALRWAWERGEVETGLRLAGSLGWFSVEHGHLAEVRAWLDVFLASARPDEPPPPIVRARAYVEAGLLASWQSDYAAAAARLETGLALAREAGDKKATASALFGLGQLAGRRGEHNRAERYAEEALTLARELNDTWSIASMLNDLALAPYYQGELSQALPRAEEAVRIARETGDPSGVATNLDTLARVVVRQGKMERAVVLSHEALALVRQFDGKLQYAGALELAAMIAGIAGDGGRAARLLGAAAAVRETFQVLWPDEERADVEDAVAAARAALGEEAWMAAFAVGKSLTPEDAIAEAFDEGEASAHQEG